MIKLKSLISEIRVEPKGYTFEDCNKLFTKIVNNTIKQKGVYHSKDMDEFMEKNGFGKIWKKGWKNYTPKEFKVLYKLLLQYVKENNIPIK